MACRKVLADLREARQEHFPSHPRRNQVSSRQDAERLLLRNKWVEETAPGLPERVKAERIEQHLTDAHTYYQERCQAGDWIPVFSGKEIVQEQLAWLSPRKTLEDLAKAVAQAQRQQARAPAELMELRDALAARSPAVDP